MGTIISNRFVDYHLTMPSYLAIIIDLEGIKTFLGLFEFIHNQEETFTQGLSKISLDDAFLLVRKTREYLEPIRTGNRSFFQSYEIIMQQTLEKELIKISRKSWNKAQKARIVQPQQIKEIKSQSKETKPQSIDTSSQKVVAHKRITYLPAKRKKKKGPDLLDKCLPGCYGMGKRR